MKNETNDDEFPAGDPLLTAYALGELEGEERATIEARLAHDAAARATVESVRALAGQVTAALAAESAPAVKPLAAPRQRAADINGRDVGKLDGGLPRPRGSVIRFPQFYYVVSGLAAACFVIFVATRSPETPRPQQKHYTEITVVPVALPAAEVTDAESPAAEELPPDIGSAASTPGLSANYGSVAAAPLETGLPLSLLGGSGSAWASDEMRFGGARTPWLSVGGNPEPVGKFAIQPVAYLHPQDDKFVVPTRRKPASPLNGLSANTFSGFLLAAERAQRNLTVSGGWLDRLPVGKGRSARVTSQLFAASLLAPRIESYAYVRDNDFLVAAQNPLSTFSIDVDTASYANVRRFLQNGQRPPVDAVRIEELVNYFPYRYPTPNADGAKRGEGTPPTIAAHLEVATAPWAPEHRLVRIGLKGREVAATARPPANLVFLIDVSASMNELNKLPLVKESMRVLVDKLRPDDRVAIVTYAGSSGLALPSTPVARVGEIISALNGLVAGGSTNGGMGLELAYDIAKANFVPGGVNRVILCTDGDFNVGVTSESELTRLVSEKAKSGVFLTALGFGMGNLKDAVLEKLADTGNGNHGYIDTRREAEKLLVQQVNGTLLTIAKDVKLQVEFNPARVASYRLIGYENRLLKKEDFNNDEVDAGEIGAGHTVTALYEIVLAGEEEGHGVGAVGSVDPLKYAVKENPKAAFDRSRYSDELLTVKVRYKDPSGDVSQKIEFALKDAGARFAEASPDFKFAAAVAGFGMILRDSPHKGTATWARVAEWAEAGVGEDEGGWRSEFVTLAHTAKTIMQ